MKILFTGASSFTGYWFVKELAAAGHELVMTFTRELGQYEGIRRQRVDAVGKLGQTVCGCRFGDQQFLALVKNHSNWDLLCHHAADVTNYKSLDFDVSAAVNSNTNNLRDVLTLLSAKGCSRILISGSVFEGGEGAGSEGVPAFSPYGLSKELTARVFQFFTQTYGLRLAKFVIPNPFGAFEEPRFTAYLIQSWFEDKTPTVSTPAYVRDNIHVSLLAKAYADFAAHLPASGGLQKINPSGYIETQGAFARRFAEEMRGRINLPCEIMIGKQTDYSEPRIRINTDPVHADLLRWDETSACDAIAEYYARLHSPR
jgi:nucleoside-diphosphate-sugar epimerase